MTTNPRILGSESVRLRHDPDENEWYVEENRGRYWEYVDGPYYSEEEAKEKLLHWQTRLTSQPTPPHGTA